MLSRIDHIGIVTADAEKVVRLFEEALGVKVAKTEHTDPGFAKCTFLQLDNIQIEITEPYDPDHFYTDMVKQRGTCLSHLAFSAGDVEGECGEIEGRGMGFREGFGPGAKTPRGYSIAFLDPDQTEGVQIQLIAEHPTG